MKIYLFLTINGRDAYKVPQTVYNPQVHDDYNYNELITLLTKRYTPVRLQIAESFIFRKCVQKESDSINDYVSRLHKCAPTCDSSTFLDRALRYNLQLVYAVRNLSLSCFPRNILLRNPFSKLLLMRLLLGSLLILYLVPLLQIV